MIAKVDIAAGICGFRTVATVTADDSQAVAFTINSDCEKIQKLAAKLTQAGPIDAYQEISPESPSVLMQTVRDNLCGCCAGCAVPAGLFKAMQVAAGLALPKDIIIKLSQE